MPYQHRRGPSVTYHRPGHPAEPGQLLSGPRHDLCAPHVGHGLTVRQRGGRAQRTRRGGM